MSLNSNPFMCVRRCESVSGRKPLLPGTIALRSAWSESTVSAVDSGI